MRRVDLAEDPLDFAGFDGVFHLAGQPGVRSFGDVFPLYLRRNVLASQRVFEAACGDGVQGRLRVLVVDLRRRRALPDARGRRAASDLAVRDHEARCEHLADAYAREFGLDCVVLALLQRSTGRGSVPTWRSRGSSTRSRATRTFELYGDGAQSRG